MGERKVLNKYYPPDFDPSKIPRGSRTKTNEMKVRMMLPMSVRCKTCGTFMYKGTKFNTRKEDVIGETYLGIQVIRFYYRCSNCAAEYTMKTDPKNGDYQLEEGATRNYEPWRAQDVEKATVQQEREEEEEGNVMKALENRTLERKRELDILANLDELRSLNARHGAVTTEQALAALLSEGAKQDEEEEEEKVEPLPEEDEAALRAFLQSQQAHRVKRLDDSDDEVEGGGPSTSKVKATMGALGRTSGGLQVDGQAAGTSGSGGGNGTAVGDLERKTGEKSQPRGPSLLPVKIVAKRKAPAAAEEDGTDGAKKAKQGSDVQQRQEDSDGSGGSPAGGGLLGLQSYSSSDGDS